ncbi:patatin-like phospholipase family protein [Bacillus sp. V59.32b]|uniref:patatin-like phospholipase family protein n=1 Tax=Bacillus sp. V59.32b TaxID=1758642 RepID=UPI000E3B761C|nr:patatin-like phospholipase family protein [Bacillus sp. V59.32b]RFU69644.1 patatin [Bacillus sp. V59.32b]
MNHLFRNLIFEGGGVKGIGFVGALKVLEDKHILDNVKRFGGTSAGAITVLILGLGYTISELENILSVLDFRKFKDDTVGPVRDAFRLTQGYGWFKGDHFENWIEGIIEKKTGDRSSTFKDIHDRMESDHFKEIFFQGTNVSTHLIETFSFEKSPDMPVAKAVRISMSIPFFFEAVKWKDDLYVDGGILDNYPIRSFDWERYVTKEEHYSIPNYYAATNHALSGNGPYDTRVYNKETLGIRLESKEDINAYMHNASPKRHEIKDLPDFTWHLMRTIMRCQRNMHLNENDSARTIYIDSLDVSAVDFDIPPETKLKLIESGRTCAENYFTSYGNPE